MFACRPIDGLSVIEAGEIECKLGFLLVPPIGASLSPFRNTMFLEGRWTMMPIMIALALGTPLAVGVGKEGGKERGSLASLAQCRAIADTASRLACYDREVSEIETKIADKKLAVVVPRPGGLSGNGSNNENEFDVLTTVASTVSRSNDGSVGFTLPNGTSWIQTDSTALFGLKNGMPLVLKRASLGSYFAKLGTNIAVRVKRVQ